MGEEVIDLWSNERPKDTSVQACIVTLNTLRDAKVA